ncbi:MAG: hypothetical protein Q7W55_11270 [Pseudohongiella sp.]|nr:hypothetical protein [Pseudohongiella sp.]MDO9519612.1 hypothetical protein [Pseudohongiella sp.]
MDMDIQLQPSFYLQALRICFFSMATLAILTSDIDWIYRLLLGIMVLLQMKSGATGRDSECGLQFLKDGNIEEQIGNQKVILELRSQRRIELTLTGFYCLWWIQILYLHSSHRTSIVVVLPDSCSAEERRRLRQLLR